VSGFSPFLLIGHFLQVRVAVPDVNLVMALADVELLVQRVGSVLGQPVPLASQLVDQALGVSGDQVDHVAQGWDFSCSQFHQHFMSSFYTNILVLKSYKATL